MQTPYKLAREWLVSHPVEAVKHLFPDAQIKGNECLIGDLDGNPDESLHITIKGPKTGLWKDLKNGDRGSRDMCALWKAARKIAHNDHQTVFAELSSFSGQSFDYTPPDAPIAWPKCLADWS